MREEDLERDRIRFEIPSTKQTLTLTEATFFMRNKGINEFLINEIKQDGLGADIFKEAQESDGHITLKNFLIWLNAHICGQAAIHELLRDFKYVEIMEQYSDYFKLRVQK